MVGTVRLSVGGTVHLLVGGTVLLSVGDTGVVDTPACWDQFQDMGVEHHRCRHTQL